MSQPTLVEALTNAILAGTKEVEGRERFDPDNPTWGIDPSQCAKAFMNEWFFNNQFDPKNDGHYGSFFFLHLKSASVTDSARSELRSLIQLYSKQSFAEKQLVVYYTTTEFTEIVENLIASLSPNAIIKDDAEEFLDLVEKITSAYRGMFERAVLIDHYFTSATVHIPPSLRLSIDEVVGTSGYIHSAGRLIYIREMSKSYDRDITERIKKYLDAIGSTGKPVSVTPYAKEFFDPFEKFNSNTSTRNGLDNVKFNIAKQYVGSGKLLNYLQQLESDPELSGRIVIPSGLEDYTEERLAQGADDSRTIWFVSDYSTSKDVKSKKYRRDDDRYIIIYGQTIYNKSQLITYKERKPAWYAPVTVPSTLSASLINATRLSTSSNSIRILDPFCGAGTFLFDAAVRYDGSQIFGMDKNPIVPTIVKDNILFFSEEEAALKAHGDALSKNDIGDRLISLLEEVKAEKDLSSLVAATNYIIDNDFQSSSFIKYFSFLSFAERMEHYIAWRAFVSNRFQLSRKPEVRDAIFLDELKKCRSEFASLSSHVPVKPVTEPISKFPDTYSRATKINPLVFRKLSDRFLHSNIAETDADSSTIALEPALRKSSGGISILSVSNSINALDQLCGGERVDHSLGFDLIITDPPYGVNTIEGGEDVLFALFQKIVPVFCKLLRPRGELILTLPKFTRNGQSIPYYQTQGIIVPQLRTTLSSLDVDFGEYRITEHYWSSPSVLDRTVAHVKLL